MKVLNIHKRTITKPKEKVSRLLETLATKTDEIWPIEHWPAIKFKDGLNIGSKGGHGPIKYTIEKYQPHDFIQFRFSKPVGFKGIHKFEILALEKNKTEIRHTIEMTTVGISTLIWIIVICPLHNALLEDALDKIENRFIEIKKKTTWNLLVKIWRYILA